MNLEQWDKRIAPKLQDLEYCGGKLAFYARHIQASIQSLPQRPSWETLAREALDDAEKELRTALAVVQAAKRMYDDTPIASEAAE